MLMLQRSDWNSNNINSYERICEEEEEEEEDGEISDDISLLSMLNAALISKGELYNNQQMNSTLIYVKNH